MKNTPFEYLLSAILLLIFIKISPAQRGFGPGFLFGRGPVRLGIQYNNFDPATLHQVTATLSQPGGMSFRQKAPSRIQISSLNLAGGVRFDSQFNSAEFRWRAGLLDLNINRKLLLIGGTLLDYDKSNRLDKDLRWFNVRLGLRPTLGRRLISISPFLIGTVGAGSWRLGQTNYPKLDMIADSSYSGVEGGYRTGLSVRFTRKLTISAEFARRILVDGQEPRFQTISAKVGYMLGTINKNIVGLYVKYFGEKTNIRDSDIKQENRMITAGIYITLIPKIPEVVPWY